MSPLDRRALIMGATLLTGRSALALPPTQKTQVSIETGRGTITVELEIGHAPLTCANFLHYVAAAKYDGGAFYRAVRTSRSPGKGTIVGGPSPRAHPYPPIAHESTTTTGLRHRTGTISLGRFAPGSATADFFICASDEPYLDAHPGAKGDNLGFAAFGQVVRGLSVVRDILARPTNGDSPFVDQRGQWLASPVPIFSMRRVI